MQDKFPEILNGVSADELRRILSSIPAKLHELAKILRNAKGSPEQIRIAEHDACLIASGYLKGYIEIELKKLQVIKC